jgi:hypothetical protein
VAPADGGRGHALRAQATPGVPVRCAYLELDTPDLHGRAGELIAAGATAITVVPMFLGMGRTPAKICRWSMQQLRSRRSASCFSARRRRGRPGGRSARRDCGQILRIISIDCEGIMNFSLRRN